MKDSIKAALVIGAIFGGIVASWMHIQPAFTSPAVPPTQPAAPTGPLYLDSTNYTSKPRNLTLADGRPFTYAITNGWFLFRNVVNGDAASSTDTRDVLSESGCRFLPHWAAARRAQYLIVDLEGPMFTPDNCQKIINWIRAEKVPIKLGFFEVPCAIGNAGAPPSAIAKQRELNNTFAVIAAQLDILCPNLYITNEPLDTWKARAKWSIADAKSLAPGKPVLPFITPGYVDYGGVPKELQGKLLPPSVWKSLVTGLMDVGADGFVVWDPSDNPWSVAARSWWPALAN